MADPAGLPGAAPDIEWIKNIIYIFSLPCFAMLWKGFIRIIEILSGINSGNPKNDNGTEGKGQSAQDKPIGSYHDNYELKRVVNGLQNINDRVDRLEKNYDDITSELIKKALRD